MDDKRVALPQASVQNPFRLWHNNGDMHANRRSAPRGAPNLDAHSLEKLALRYVERFATTRAKLMAYLDRKIRERGWEGKAADTAALADHMVALGYVDDRAFGEARAAAMARRGLGARRISGAFYVAGIGAADAAALAPAIAERAEDAALSFARRRKFGPYAQGVVDRAGRQRQFAAMLRAGHDMELARRILAMAPADEPGGEEEDDFGTGGASF